MHDFDLELALLIAGFAVSLAVPAVAVASERTGRRLGRLGFLTWLAPYVAVGGIKYVVGLAGMAWAVFALASAVEALLAWFLYRAAVQRARDIGWGKLVPALCVVPWLGVVTFAILLLVEGAPASPLGGKVPADAPELAPPT